MRLIIVLRLFRESHAIEGIEAVNKEGRHRGRLIHLNAERRHPALKNIADHLRSSGRIPLTRQGEVLDTANGHQIAVSYQPSYAYWCEVETELPVSAWSKISEVELVIIKEDFEQFAASIRYKSGAVYLDACDAYAQTLAVTASKCIRYAPPKKKSSSLSDGRRAIHT